MEKVSVIMSVYKEPKDWINKAIESIVKQTYTDWELIIISDNPEGYEQNKCINSWSSVDDRIKVIYNEYNVGLTVSLNKGLAISSGDYIVRMDADDIALSHRLDKQVEFLHVHQDIDICYSNFNVIDEKGFIVLPNAFEKKYTSTDYLFLLNFIAHPTVAFRRRVLEARKPLYDETYRTSQDYELWSFLADNGYNFGFLDESLLLYRHSAQQTGQKEKKPQLTNFKKIKKKRVLSFIEKYGIKSGDEANDIEMLKAVKEIRPQTSEQYKYYLICFSLYYSISLKNKKYIIYYFFDSNRLFLKLPLRYSIYVLLIFFGRNSWPRLEF